MKVMEVAQSQAGPIMFEFEASVQVCQGYEFVPLQYENPYDKL